MITKGMIQIKVGKDVEYKDIKKVVTDMLRDYFKDNLGTLIDTQGIQFKFKPPCGCPYMEMDFEEIPLEDLTCQCGKTKLIEIIRE